MLELSEKRRAKFEKNFTKGDGCWEWHAAKSDKGYGRFRVGGRPCIASRISYANYVGHISDGLCVLHHCDNPACVNPAHLFLGTMMDNMRDRDQKGRRTAPKGIKNGMCKIPEGHIEGIRADARSLREIALDYGVHLGTIWKIKHRKRWAHI